MANKLSEKEEENNNDLLKKTFDLTSNEEQSFVKNRIEQKLLNRRIGFINREHKYNTFLIKESTKDVENIYKAIRVSTGSAFNDQLEYSNKDINETSKNFGKDP